ncbi:MAG TPA: Ig-like domain-containing protein [Gemmatimonadaceae bacterium]|nr:Ig-like domain-containing protein [Gemmatimonadaceae bacterium]
MFTYRRCLRTFCLARCLHSKGLEMSPSVQQRIGAGLKMCALLALLSCTGSEATAPMPPIAVASVQVTVPRAIVHVGDSIQASATLLSETGSTISGRAVAWSSDNVAVAVVAPTGMVKAAGLGIAHISAASEGISGQATLSVTVIPIGAIAFVPDTASVPVGQAKLLVVSVKDSVGNTVTGRTLTWGTSDPSKAAVSSTGVVTGLAAGTVQITASAEGKTGIATITIRPIVSAASVVNVTVTLPRNAFRAGESLQAAALPLDSLGGVLTGRNILWSSSNPEVASVTPSGIVTGLGVGTSTISASVEGKSGSVTVQVSLVPVDNVTITPAIESISAGATITLTAIVKDSANRVLAGRTVSWASENPAIASVTQAGLVTAILVGTTDIVATVEGKQAKATVTVNTSNAVVSTVTVTPGAADMSGG